jgi:hypothetical protein
MNDDKTQLIDLVYELRPILENYLKKTKDVDLVLNALISSLMNIIISYSHDCEKCGNGVTEFLMSSFKVNDAWLTATREVLFKWDDLDKYRYEDIKNH